MSKIKEKQMKKRSAIIETAVSLMDNIAFEDLSVNDICEAAGISTGTFYHYFEKKTDILVGLLSLIDDDLEEKVFPHLTSESEADNLMSIASGFAAHVSAYGLARSWPVSRAEISDNTTTGAKRELQVKIEEIILRGQQKGQLIKTKSCEELARYFLISLRAVSVDWTRRNAAYSITEFMDEYISFFLRALKSGD